jgi:hypothetical protein
LDLFMQKNAVVIPHNIVAQLRSAMSCAAIQKILEQLPVADPNDYVWTKKTPEVGWQDGKLHWVPIGADRGNSGRIRLAGDPYNPAAERLINGMEALIELERRRELQKNPQTLAPTSPRVAVERYFGLPRLDHIPRIVDKEKRRGVDETLRDLRRKLYLRLDFDKPSRDFSFEIADQGIGQSPAKVHETLLSLGDSEKPDKAYLIGVFGQGGSSTYAASKYSIVLTRRAAELLDGDTDGYGWTIVQRISMAGKGRRDVVFAYLAASPDGRVPIAPISAQSEAGFSNGSVFRHIGYDFGAERSAIARTLYYAMNHVLFNPLLPYDLFASKETPDAMYGTAYRLSRQTTLLSAKGVEVLDKVFLPQSIDG